MLLLLLLLLLLRLRGCLRNRDAISLKRLWTMLRSSRFDLNKRCLAGMLRGSGGRSKWPGQ